MRECLIRQIPLRLATTLFVLRPFKAGPGSDAPGGLDGWTASDPTLATDADRRNSTCLVPCSWNHAGVRQCGGSRLREIVYLLPERSCAPGSLTAPFRACPQLSQMSAAA